MGVVLLLRRVLRPSCGTQVGRVCVCVCVCVLHASILILIRSNIFTAFCNFTEIRSLIRVMLIGVVE